MVYRELPWQQAEQDDQPTAAEIALESGNDPNEGVANELFDTPDETDRLYAYIEDMLSGPEPEEANPYHGNFYDFDDDAPY